MTRPSDLFAVLCMREKPLAQALSEITFSNLLLSVKVHFLCFHTPLTLMRNLGCCYCFFCCCYHVVTAAVVIGCCNRGDVMEMLKCDFHITSE